MYLAAWFWILSFSVNSNNLPFSCAFMVNYLTHSLIDNNIYIGRQKSSVNACGKRNNIARSLRGRSGLLTASRPYLEILITVR